jgi:hypothetical protein
MQTCRDLDMVVARKPASQTAVDTVLQIRAITVSATARRIVA